MYNNDGNINLLGKYRKVKQRYVETIGVQYKSAKNHVYLGTWNSETIVIRIIMIIFILRSAVLVWYIKNLRRVEVLNIKGSFKITKSSRWWQPLLARLVIFEVFKSNTSLSLFSFLFIYLFLVILFFRSTWF